jgi:hypothetical protein
MQYFVVMIDYGRRGREAVVDPEIRKREVISRVAFGEYKNISFIRGAAAGQCKGARNAQGFLPDHGTDHAAGAP